MPYIHYSFCNYYHFFPHFPSGLMQCKFSPELVPQLPHTIMEAFSKSKGKAPILFTLTMFPQQLIPNPLREVSYIGCEGYMLKDLFEKQHRWKNGICYLFTCICHT